MRGLYRPPSPHTSRGSGVRSYGRRLFYPDPTQHRPTQKLGPQMAWIDALLEADRGVHKKQRHTAQRIFERLPERVNETETSGIGI